MAIRSAMHRAGAAALSQLLQFDPPGPEQRQLPCPCGHTAKYLELRSKPVLTAVGQAQCLRPYYLCERCHHGQFPVDVELDVENTELSPGVRRMVAAVGHEGPFEQGRKQMELLAGLSVTTKAVERTAEAIGEDIEVRQQRELQRAMQLELPIPMGPRIPILYVEMDGTGIPVVRKESEGRAGKQDGQPAHTREAKLGCVFTQTTVDEEGYLESGESAFSGGHPNRRSLSRPRALVERRRQTLSQRFARPETLGYGEERQAGRGEDRTFGSFATLSGSFSSRTS